MKLHPAITLAERIVRELAPACDRIEIAGSIRRARSEVNDIDLVILPKLGKLDAIKQRCKERCRVISDGRQNFISALRIAPGEEFQLDIFFAKRPESDLLESKPGNFGSLLLCRTGSKEHNIKLAQLAKDRDMAWKVYQGLFAGGAWELQGQESVYVGGQIIASETEEDIFKALGVPFVPPVLREMNAPTGPSISEILNAQTEEAHHD